MSCFRNTPWVCNIIHVVTHSPVWSYGEVLDGHHELVVSNLGFTLFCGAVKEPMKSVSYKLLYITWHKHEYSVCSDDEMFSSWTSVGNPDVFENLKFAWDFVRNHGFTSQLKQYICSLSPVLEYFIHKVVIHNCRNLSKLKISQWWKPYKITTLRLPSLYFLYSLMLILTGGHVSDSW